MPDLLVLLLLVLLGVGVAVYGTMIGAGGGFVLAPFLLLVYQDLRPEVVTAMSLGVVLLNGASGSLAYARQRRIDYGAALLFAAATAPGAVAGAVATGFLPRASFEVAFGSLLVLLSGWLLLPRPARIFTATAPPRFRRRMLTDAHGETYSYAFDPRLGVTLGLGIGFFSSLFGIGGGVIYVPAMILLLRFPAYVAVATSTFTLMFTAGVATGVHLLSGNYAGVVGEELALGLGVLVGAQVGALISGRLAHHQTITVRLLSVALAAVGVRLLAGALI